MKKCIVLLLTILLLCSLSGCGEDQTYTLHDGLCTIGATAETAANYVWHCSFSEDGIVELTESDLSTGIDYTGYSATTSFTIKGISAGTVDVYLSYLQEYEGGSLSGITRFYELTVDENGNITKCLQLGNTLGSNKRLFAYLKANIDDGYAWEAIEWDAEVLTIGRTGAEQDTDKNQPGAYWEVFYFNALAEGVSDVQFVLRDPNGEVVHMVTYEVHVDNELTATVKLPG